MFTKETNTYHVDGESTIHDVVRLNLVMPRATLENGTVEQLRQGGGYSEEHLRMIGLVEHLVDEYGHYYGAGLIHALLCSMDADGDCGDIRAALDALGDKVDELKEGFRDPTFRRKMPRKMNHLPPADFTDRLLRGPSRPQASPPARVRSWTNRYGGGATIPLKRIATICN